jgi:hypothetical protein
MTIKRRTFVSNFAKSRRAMAHLQLSRFGTCLAHCYVAGRSILRRIPVRMDNVRNTETVSPTAEVGPKTKSATATIGGISKVVLSIYAIVAAITVAAVLLYFSGKF